MSSYQVGQPVGANLDELHAVFCSARKVYPTLAAASEATANSSAYTLGANKEIMPATVTSKNIIITGLHVTAATAGNTFEIVIYKGASGSEVEVGRTFCTSLSEAGRTITVPFGTAKIPPSTRISTKISSSSAGSDTASIAIQYVEVV